MPLGFLADFLTLGSLSVGAALFNGVEELVGEAKFKDARAKVAADGRAHAVLEVLEARGVVVPDDIRDRILSCSDVDTLRRWLTRAVQVARATDVIAPT